MTFFVYTTWICFTPEKYVVVVVRGRPKYPNIEGDKQYEMTR
jgi:hypothetical protein